MREYDCEYWQDEIANDYERERAGESETIAPDDSQYIGADDMREIDYNRSQFGRVGQ